MVSLYMCSRVQGWGTCVPANGGSTVQTCVCGVGVYTGSRASYWHRLNVLDQLLGEPQCTGKGGNACVSVSDGD